MLGGGGSICCVPLCTTKSPFPSPLTTSNSLKHRLQLLGFEFKKPDLDILYKRFLDVADIKKEVNDKDLVELAREMQVGVAA